METSAAYWEARIKTYGFHNVKDLCLFALTIDKARLGSLGLALCRMGEADIGFHLAFSCVSSEGMEIFLLVPRQVEGVLRALLEETTRENEGTAIVRSHPAELVSFQGPHFGDRYGIADVALRALTDWGVKILAIACSGSCVYIALPAGQSERAVRALSESFHIPRVTQRRTSVGNGA